MMQSNITLAAAKREVIERRSDGVICPCCEQFVKEYSRTLTSSMAIGLIAITQRFQPYKKFHLENFIKTQRHLPSSIRGDLPKLKHWNLLLSVEDTRPDECHRNGFYELTNAGLDFVNKKIKIAKYVVLFNSKVIRYTGHQVSIDQCLKDKFNYAELMQKPNSSSTERGPITPVS